MMAWQFLHRVFTSFYRRQACVMLLLCLGGTVTLPAQQLVTKANGAAPAFQPARFTVPEGFMIELVAGPPLLHHPTLGCLDDQGRLFVADNAGVNLSAAELEKQLPNSIRMLEDTDGDGRFDKSTLFADKMTYPMGGAWHNGALYVASPPNIWRLEDTDGDGVADKRDVLVGQFGYTGNAASIHGCFAGPDGRLYWCDGRHGHEILDEKEQVTSKLAGSYIFSCKPDGSDVRIHCGGGMDNPVEVDFTNEGEMIGTVNIMFTRPRIDCLVHWLHGGVYPHSERVLYERKRTGDLLGPVHHFGHVAVSGTTRYRSGGLSPEFQDHFFTALFNGGKVLRVELEREGSTFSAVQREFLTGISPDIHITDVLEDADGSLLVIDTGGWFYRGCPTSQYSKPDVKGAIYRIRHRDMKRVADPWGKQIQWEQLPPGELIQFLDDKRFKVSERAIAECTRRGQSIVPWLSKLLDEPHDVQGRHAIWALTRIIGDSNTRSARDAIRKALASKSSSIRLTACRSVATYPDPAAVETLITMLRDANPAIRREVAKAIGRAGDSRAVAHLLSRLHGDMDRAEEHALIYALIEINKPVITARLLEAESPVTPPRTAEGIRRGLIAVHQMDPRLLASDTMLRFLDSDNQSLRMLALDIVRQHAEWADQVLPMLDRWLTSQSELEKRSNVARGLLATYLATPAVQELVGTVLNQDQPHRWTHTWLMETIATGRSVPLAKSWIDPIQALLSSRDPETLRLGISVVRAIKTDFFHARLTAVAADLSTPALLRVEALSAVAGNRSSLSPRAFQILLQLASNGTADDQDPIHVSASDTARAAQLLGGASLDRDQLLALAPLLEQVGPLELLDLIRPFSRNSSLDIRSTFLASLEQSRSFLSLPHQVFSDIIKRYPDELRPRANKMLDRLKEKDQRQAQQLDELLPLLKSGNAERGKELFANQRTKCASCHQVNGQGGKIGPDLSNIGANRQGRDLLESIVLPSASLVRQYEAFSVVTTQGRVLTGLIARETEEAIYVQQQTGDPVMIPRSEIDELVPSTISIMPSGLEKDLSQQQLADLIAYLRTLKQTP